MVRRLVLLLPVVVFLGVGLYLARALFSGEDPSRVATPLIDRPAPTFQLPPLPGHADGLASGDLAGGVHLVNVFASWCAPCRAEHETLAKLAAESGTPLLGIAYKDDPAATARFLAEEGNPYRRIGVDRDGRVSIDWGVYGVPETYLVDGQGRIRYKQVGPLVSKEAVAAMRAAIAKLGG